MNDGVVCFGDLFRLRYVNRRRGSAPLYIISAEKGGREYYPRIGTVAHAVLLNFIGTPDQIGQPISSRATVQLATTEDLVGAANTLGAWKGDHFLYYHPAGRPEQSWQIEVPSSQFQDGKLHACVDIILTNRESSERRMVQDQKEPDYLTVDEGARGFWQIELAPPDEQLVG
jgi:hypothetical protein